MKKSVKQPTGLVKSSKSIARSLAFVGSVVSVGAVAVSAVGGLFAYKLYRLSLIHICAAGDLQPLVHGPHAGGVRG